MKLLASCLLLLLCASCASDPQTLCNPLDLDYAPYKRSGHVFRHGADPVVVLYNNRYYLFSTWDVAGYRVSDDLATWQTIPFAPGTELAGTVYTAAAVAQVGDWLYFLSIPPRGQPTSVYRTQSPDTGRWEKVGTLPPYSDPCLFVDPPTSKTYIYYGLDRPIHGVEVDLATCREVGSPIQLMPTFTPGDTIENGWEICTWDNNPASPPMRSNKTHNPCREGAWMTYHNGTYLLQYASPGTTVPGYADGLLTGKSPLGPFSYSNHSPISHKDTGFITSAGHSCLFQDRHHNWWRAVTMLVGVHDRFERRIGLFPAGFTDDGIPFTRTDTVDLPILIPSSKQDPSGTVTPDWCLLSHNKRATASSSLPDHPPALAADENVRTHWSAATGNAGEWFQLDLGTPHTIRAIQVNLAQQDYLPTLNNTDQFAITTSEDGQTWNPVPTKSANAIPAPHAYVQLDHPRRRARYIKVENHHTPNKGKFALSDLRIFGDSTAPRPSPVTTVRATRNPQDRRQATLTWSPAKSATGYLVRYGTTPTHLNRHHLIRDPHVTELTLYSLNHQPPYSFRVDSISESGVTEGQSTAEAP